MSVSNKQHCGVTMSVAGTAGQGSGDILQCQRCGYRCYDEPERAYAEQERIWLDTEQRPVRTPEGGNHGG